MSSAPAPLSANRVSVPSAWQSHYPQYNKVHRLSCRIIALDGLLELLSRYETMEEIREAWPMIQNPLAVVAQQMFAVPSQATLHQGRDGLMAIF
jgi:hypothetical protein